jgi:hypothetical protein
MAYKEITGAKTYIKYKDASEGDTLLEDAVFKGTEPNQFGGLNFNFEQQGQSVVLPSCGALKYALEQGKLKVGALYKIDYDGEGVMEKGPMKGKSFHKIKIWEDDTSVEEAQEEVPF